MKVITFSLQTQQPLLATSFQGDPNSDVSYSYIPGSMIRGAVIKRYLEQNNLSELDLNEDKVRRLFFNADNTCYLNAYLQDKEGKRTLPIPYSWFKEKNAELTDESPIQISDFSLDRDDDLKNPKPVGEGFWTIERGNVVFYTEKRRINIHNQRDRQKGRSIPVKRNQETQQLQGEGEIFRYEAIDSEQTFQAIVLCSIDTDAQMIRDLLKESSDIWLGGSQSAGYGHARIININNIVDSTDWNEVNISADDDDRTDREYLTITLLSDLILRDDCGQYAIIPPSTKHEIATPLTGELQELLGREIQPRICFNRSAIVGGFNRKWGLPLPTSLAFAAGSVFVFELEKENLITTEQIQNIEIKGIGERRVEGFGRIAINWLNKEKFPLQLPNRGSSNTLPSITTQASLTLATNMAERILYQKVEQALQIYVGRTAIRGDIHNSQLSRLQLLTRQALTTGDCHLVLSFLRNLPPNASGQFEKAKIGVTNQPLKQQLEQWLEYPPSWSWIANTQDLRVNIAGVERTIDDKFARSNKLAEKFTLKLIMALAKKATKENKI